MPTVKECSSDDGERAAEDLPSSYVFNNPMVSFETSFKGNDASVSPLHAPASSSIHVPSTPFLLTAADFDEVLAASNESNERTTDFLGSDVSTPVSLAIATPAD